MKPVNQLKIALAALGLIVFVALGVVLSHYVPGLLTPSEEPPVPAAAANNSTHASVSGVSTKLRVFYPAFGGMMSEERVVKGAHSRVSAISRAIEEFLGGPSGGRRFPLGPGVELIGIYDGDDGILYLDFSGDINVNFNGNAMDEFMLLRALYETVLANAKGVAGVVVLIDGTEAETLGGHLSLLGTLGDVVGHVAVSQ